MTVQDYVACMATALIENKEVVVDGVYTAAGGWVHKTNWLTFDGLTFMEHAQLKGTDTTRRHEVTAGEVERRLRNVAKRMYNVHEDHDGARRKREQNLSTLQRLASISTPSVGATGRGSEVC